MHSLPMQRLPLERSGAGNYPLPTSCTGGVSFAHLTRSCSTLCPSTAMGASHAAAQMLCPNQRPV